MVHIGYFEDPEPFRKWLEQRPKRWKAKGDHAGKCSLSQYLKEKVRSLDPQAEIDVWSTRYVIDGNEYELPRWAEKYSLEEIDYEIINRTQALKLLESVLL
jgi:hypothetical protein